MTHPLIDVLDNAVLAWGLVACGLAQLSKLLIELVVHRRWRPSVLVETGGMPSSHSALMTGTSAGIGWLHGFGDPLFALAAVVTFVILYDASGVVDQEPVLHPLKENLGHTRLEVLAGSLIGPAVALPGLVWGGSPLHLARALLHGIG
jgi:acid phosphatase family membrane protein YuiD